MLKIKGISILLFVILLCGCEKRECVKSHEEEGRCVRYTHIYTGKTMISIPRYYACTKTICDEYKVVEE